MIQAVHEFNKTHPKKLKTTDESESDIVPNYKTVKLPISIEVK